MLVQNLDQGYANLGSTIFTEIDNRQQLNLIWGAEVLAKVNVGMSSKGLGFEVTLA